jgi:hypothetical protein
MGWDGAASYPFHLRVEDDADDEVEGGIAQDHEEHPASGHGADERRGRASAPRQPVQATARVEAEESAKAILSDVP